MKTFSKLLIIPALLLVLVVPHGAQAETTTETISRLQQIVQLYQRLFQSQSQLEALQGGSDTSSNTTQVSVQTDAAQQVEMTSAELNGNVDFKERGDARVWFTYGPTTAMSRSTPSYTIANKSAGSSFDFSRTVSSLSKDQTYYFRAMAEGENGTSAHGTTRSFTTSGSNSSDNNNEPDVVTGDVASVTDSSGRLEGEVDMNDFDNGEVFFVYGEDEDVVDSVTDENSYNDIDESGSDLQKVVVSNSFDDNDTFTKSISGLQDDTDIYYRLCVSYTDENDDDALECGDVEQFTTEKN